MSDQAPDGFVTLAEACRRLGVSDRTIRRRVQAGELEGEHVPRPQGTVLYVRLPASGKSEEIAEENQGNAGGEQAALVDALLVRLDTAQAALLAATERAAAAEATAASLREQLERERAETERLRRPWWRRWTG